MMSYSQIRDERLVDLSKMVIDGTITYKIDHIATVHINGRHYFNVFRRYNSPYNIVIEDNNSDIYLHQDYTIRKSLQTVLCLPEWDAANIYTWNATSYKHNGPIPSISHDIADMRWTEVHTQYYAINVNFGGIFHDLPLHQNTVIDPPSTPIAQIRRGPIHPPNAPERPDHPISDVDAAHILLTLSIPPQPNPQFFVMSESDGPTLSMRFADIKKRNEHISCWSETDSDDDEDDEANYDEDDENNYTVLRSGTYIPKPFTH
jgi:hypothetical protein